MRPAEQHLTPQELEELLFAASDREILIADGEAAQSAKQHLESCAACQEMAKKHANAEGMLETLRAWGQGSRPPKTAARRADCPPEDVWARVATGLVNEGVAAQYVSHAAGCDWCGRLLRESMEDLAQDVSAEEQAAIAQLPSAGAEWQREMAARIASTVATNAFPVPAQARKKTPEVRTRTNFVWWPRVALAVLVILVIGISGWWVWAKASVPFANRLLAQTYSAHRSSELRMRGAAYGPVSVQRGADRRNFPASFDVAEWIIKINASRHGDDPEWLQARARSDLLEGDYDGAIQKLDDGLALRPGDSALLLEKAMALFERAKNPGSRNEIDCAEAAEDLSLVLRQIPDDRVALFNRAIVYDRMHMPDQAIADLQRFLSVEPSGPWSDEAQKLLSRLKQTVQSHAEQRTWPLLDAAAFVRSMGNPDAMQGIDERIEDYQNLAIDVWLPNAFPISAVSAQTDSSFAALRALAELLRKEHRDRWLDDLLNESNRSIAFVDAIGELRVAISHSVAGDPTGAFQASKQAAALFARGGSHAGAARAEVEQVHALQRSQHGDLCLAVAKQVEAARPDTDYAWLHAQLAIDESSCSIMMGNYDRAHAFAAQAESTASTNHYVGLWLRALGIDAANDTDAGNLSDAWAKNEKGLAAYWESGFPSPIRAHQFYTDLAYAAEDLSLWNLALALEEEGLRRVVETQNQSSEAMTRSHVARAAIRAADFPLAVEELRKSGALFGALPPTEATETYRLDTEIQLAAAELEMGETEVAQQTLDSVRSQVTGVDSIASFTIPLTFYKTEGMMLERQGRLEDAEDRLAAAMHIADQNLQGIENPANRVLWSEDPGNVYRSLAHLEMIKGDYEKALAVWEWYRSAQLRGAGTAVVDFDPFLSLEKFRALSSRLAKQTVISYAVMPEGLAVWVFDDRGTQGRLVTIDVSRLLTSSLRFSELCADRDSDLESLKGVARSLYDVLISPVKDRLMADRTLVIETDGALGEIPFQALIADNGRYLGEDYQIVYSPGLAYEIHLRPASPLGAEARALVVSSSAILTSLGRAGALPNGPEEAQVVGHYFSRSRVLTDIDGNTLEAQLKNAELFHFVGHAVSTSRQEGLVLPSSERGGGATLWESTRFRSNSCPHCRLIVLSACSTGRSSQSRLEAHGSLVRGVLAAGVPSVMASRWDVDSLATGELMRAFYKNLSQGQAVSVAMTAAAADLRQQPEWKHPYFWAAFSVFGRGGQ